MEELIEISGEKEKKKARRRKKSIPPKPSRTKHVDQYPNVLAAKICNTSLRYIFLNLELAFPIGPPFERIHGNNPRENSKYRDYHRPIAI
jgi:hypothetical protein